MSGIEPLEGGISKDTFSHDLFTAAPEFGIWLAKNDLDMSLALTFAQSQTLLDRNVQVKANRTASRVQSLLNPDNIHQFFLDHSSRKYSLLMQRFTLTSE